MSAAAAKRTVLAAASILAIVALSVLVPTGGASSERRDSEPPTTPRNVRVAGATQSLVRIAWDPSTDNVGVKGYYVFGDKGKATVDVIDDEGKPILDDDGKPIGDAPGFTVEWLACGESTQITVIAFDASQNRSGKATVTVSTAPCGDLQPPTAPSAFTQVATSTDSVVLAWAASSDNVGVVEYGVNRNLQRVATPTQPTVTLTGLSCGSTYEYAIDAADAAGNRSPLATAYVQTASCPSPSDTISPSTPTGLAASNITQTGLALNWNASSDNVGVTGYDVYRNGTKVASVTSTSATQSGLSCGTSYPFGVRARDAAGRTSAAAQLTVSTAACSTTPPPTTDTISPSTPTGLAASDIAQTALALDWNASSDNVGVTGYDVYRNGARVASVTSTTVNQSTLSCGTSYPFAVRALDAAGRTSAAAQLTVSTADCSTTPPPTDTTPPSTPAGLGISSATRTSVSLSWNPSTDNVAVTGYRSYRDGVYQSTTTQPPTTVSGLSCGTAYTFEVDAFDAVGNASNRASVIGSTLACPDTQAPSAPTGVVANSRTATSIALIWNASTDNFGVVGYSLYRGGTATGSSSTTTGIFSGLTCNTNYTLGVDAYDAAGNRSGVTTVMVATTACPDTTPPSSPTGLATSSVTQTGMTLSWAASTDNVGVTGYDVYADGIKVGSTASTSYPLVNLACGKSYTLGVEAYDAMHNVSARATRSATTAACSLPTNTTPPAISGTTQVESTLTVSDGTWSGATPMSYSYQWQRCDSVGANCASISGETQKTHVLASTDQASTLRAVVRATNSGGSTSATSSASSVVTAPSSQQTSCDKVAAPTGSDSNPGTLSAPLGSAQGLFNALGSGQTGCLRGGTYSSSAMYVLDLGGKTNVKIRSYPGERAKLVGVTVIRPTASGAQLSYLNFEGTGVMHTIKIYSSDIRIEHNDITTKNQAGSCMMLGSSDPAYGWATRITIGQNRFHDCGSPANDNKDHAIYANYLQDSEITGNVFYNTSGYTIQLYPNSQRNRFSYNVVDGGGVSVRGGVLFGGDYGLASSNNAVEYNVIAFAAGYDISYYWGTTVGSGNVARNNCVWQGGSGEISAQVGFTASNNTTADPLFANRSGRDYSLGAGPCRTLLGTDPAASVG